MKHTAKTLSAWLLTAVLLATLLPAVLLPAAAADPGPYYAAVYDFGADPRTRLSNVVEMTDPDGDGTYEAVFYGLQDPTGGWYGFNRCDAAGNELPQALAEVIPAGSYVYIYYYNPTTGEARAESVNEIYIGETLLLSGYYLASGSDTPTRIKPASGGYAYLSNDPLSPNNAILTLHDFTLTGEYGIGADDTLIIVLEGANVINVTDDDGLENDATTTIRGSGSLSITTLESDGIEIDDGDLILESGSVNITVTQENPDHVGDGIDIENGNIYINGGMLTIAATDHGIESDNTIEDGEHFFGVYINGGTVDITAGEEGIDVEDDLTINGGTIIIRDADIGLDCGGDALIEGGTITITSRDDGIETSEDLTINGGTITILSQNIALDVYGLLTVNGGTLTLKGENGAAWALEGIVLAPEIAPAFGKIVSEEYTYDNGYIEVWYHAADKNGDLLTEIDSDVEVKLTDDTLSNTLWLPVLMKLYNTNLPITAAATEGGEISDDGMRLVKYGRNYTYTFTPDEGYMIADVLVNGKSVGAVESYTFQKVRRAQTLEVVFIPID